VQLANSSLQFRGRRIARREIRVPIRTAEGGLPECLPGGIRVVWHERKHGILEAQYNVGATVFGCGPAESLAHQDRWRIRKIVGRLLLLPEEGNVIDMFVP